MAKQIGKWLCELQEQDEQINRIMERRNQSGKKQRGTAFTASSMTGYTRIGSLTGIFKFTGPSVVQS